MVQYRVPEGRESWPHYQPCRRCGHPRGFHKPAYDGSAWCCGTEEQKRVERTQSSCDCPGFRTVWPAQHGAHECVECGIRFEWKGRERFFCAKCERRCPHCRAYCRGGTHCPNCLGYRGLTPTQFAEDAPPLSMGQRIKLEGLFNLGERKLGAPYLSFTSRFRCVKCSRRIPHAVPAMCDDCFEGLHGFARSSTT